METALSDILDGRKVDLNTPKSLSCYFREEALLEAEPRDRVGIAASTHFDGSSVPEVVAFTTHAAELLTAVCRLLPSG